MNSKNLKVKLVKFENLNVGDREFDFFKLKSSRSSIVPIIIEPLNLKYKIIYGYHLLHIYIEYGFDSIPAILLKTDSIKEKIVFILNYHQKFFKLFPTEISRIAGYILKNKIEIDEQILKTLRISDYKNRIDEIAKIKDLNRVITDYLDEKFAPIKTCIYTVRLDSEARKYVEKLIIKFKPSLSIYNEIAQNLYEISRRDSIKVSRILTKYKLNKMIEKRGTNLEEIRKEIYRIRYPTISRYNKNIENLIRKKNIPKYIKINWDKTLEKRNLEINIKIEENIKDNRLKEFVTDDFLKTIKSIQEIIR